MRIGDYAILTDCYYKSKISSYELTVTGWVYNSHCIR